MSFRPRVYLARPSYGGTYHGGSVRSALMTPVRRDDPEAPILAGVGDGDASFLPGNFNDLLATALELRDLPETHPSRVTHFAMIHADVEAVEPGWLTTLWTEMRRARCSVISTVVALKSPARDGKTSTAIGVRGDRWGFRRHINTSERNGLPETFGPADVCGPDEVLLINTGLWLADLRDPFWDSWPGFDTRCRFAPGREGPRRRVQWRTEDWELSHDLAGAGVEYRATWAVLTHHHGMSFWSNY